jgi:hypothetical protein
LRRIKGDPTHMVSGFEEYFRVSHPRKVARPGSER